MKETQFEKVCLRDAISSSKIVLLVQSFNGSSHYYFFISLILLVPIYHRQVPRKGAWTCSVCPQGSTPVDPTLKFCPACNRDQEGFDAKGFDTEG